MWRVSANEGRPVNVRCPCYLSHCHGRAVFSTFALWLPFWNIPAFLPKGPSSFLTPSDTDKAQLLLRPPQNAEQRVYVTLTSGRSTGCPRSHSFNQPVLTESDSILLC